MEDLNRPEVIYGLLVVFFLAGFTWTISGHNTRAHRLAVPLFLCAASALALRLLVKALMAM